MFRIYPIKPSITYFYPVSSIEYKSKLYTYFFKYMPSGTENKTHTLSIFVKRFS